MFWLSAICGVVLSVELVFRAVALRTRFFFDERSYLDALIAIGCCLEFLPSNKFNSRILRPVRLLRLLRFVKMIRIIRHLECLYFMEEALTASLRVLGWASILLFAFQILTAFLVNELLFGFYFYQDGLDEQKKLEVFKYLGSFSHCLLTTFEMAIGNWPVPGRVLFENANEWWILFFLAHKLIVGFAVLGVINAVFVQETFQVASTDDLVMVLKKQKYMEVTRKKLEKLFSAADTDVDAKVSCDEFKSLLAHDEMKMWLASMDYFPSDPEALFDMLDKDSSDQLSAVEFLTGMVKLRGYARAMDLVCLMYDNNGVHNVHDTTKSQQSISKALPAESGTALGL